MDHLRTDLRHATRAMMKNPVFTLVAIASLAIGIGTNTALYALYRGIFAPNRGFKDPATLVRVSVTSPRVAHDDGRVSLPESVELRDRSRSALSDMAVYSPQTGLLDTGDQSDLVFIEEVSGNYFDLLGVTPVLGRSFNAREDDVAGAPAVAVLTHAAWLQRFDGDPNVVGRTVKVNAALFTVVGVAPPTFTGMFPLAVDLWIPTSQHGVLALGRADRIAPDRRDFYLVGRLVPGASRIGAGAVLAVVSAQMAQRTASNTDRERRAAVLAISDVAITPVFDRPIKLLAWFLMGLVGLVLLVACANLAAVLTARAVASQRQIGIRLALGASRWRLARSLLTESLLLSGLGCLGGLVFSRWVVGLILALHPPLPFTISLRVPFDWSALVFACGLALATGLVFGLLPAKAYSDAGLMAILKGPGGRSSALPRRLSLGNGLVVGQVAISTVLLLFAGLLLRSLALASSVDRGFDLRQGLVFQLPLEQRRYTPPQALAFVSAVQPQLSAIPGVDAVCVVRRLPLDLNDSSILLHPQGTAVAVPDRGFTVGLAEVGSGYFRTLGIPLISGRAFTEADAEGAPLVAIVNRRFAERFWQGQSPIGKQVRAGKDVLTIVGVAQNGRYSSLGEPQRLFMYRPLYQYAFYRRMLTVVVRTGRDTGSIAAAVRQAVRSIDPDMPLFDVKTVRDYLGLTLYLPRLLGTVATGLGLVVLLLGATGLFGVLSYDVSTRTKEIGVRVAVGASARDVVVQTMGSALSRVAIGIGIGVVATTLASRGLEAVLIGVSRLDPVSYGGVAVLLLVVSAAATAPPARRAGTIDPIRVLRQE